MFLIIKVNVLIDLRYFTVYCNRYRPVELTKNMEGVYQVMENVDHYGCLNKKNSRIRLQWLEVLITFVGVAGVSFY